MLFNFIVSLILKHDFTKAVKNVTLLFSGVIIICSFYDQRCFKGFCLEVSPLESDFPHDVSRNLLHKIRIHAHQMI